MPTMIQEGAKLRNELKLSCDHGWVDRSNSDWWLEAVFHNHPLSVDWSPIDMFHIERERQLYSGAIFWEWKKAYNVKQSNNWLHKFHIREILNGTSIESSRVDSLQLVVVLYRIFYWINLEMNCPYFIILLLEEEDRQYERLNHRGLRREVAFDIHINTSIRVERVSRM